ncbi:MAG: hypothetical protein EZS28_007252, partial [Streblomastix strix]
GQIGCYEIVELKLELSGELIMIIYGEEFMIGEDNFDQSSRDNCYNEDKGKGTPFCVEKGEIRSEEGGYSYSRNDYLFIYGIFVEMGEDSTKFDKLQANYKTSFIGDDKEEEQGYGGVERIEVAIGVNACLEDSERIVNRSVIKD